MQFRCETFMRRSRRLVEWFVPRVIFYFFEAPRGGVPLRQLCSAVIKLSNVFICCMPKSKLENQIRATNSISIVCKFHLTACGRGWSGVSCAWVVGAAAVAFRIRHSVQLVTAMTNRRLMCSPLQLVGHSNPRYPRFSQFSISNCAVVFVFLHFFSHLNAFPVK